MDQSDNRFYREPEDAVVDQSAVGGLSPRCVEDKLQIARIRLQETKLEKTGLNKFSNYTYFQLGDFLPKIQEICGSLGLFGQVSFTADMATLTITNTEAREQTLTFTSPMSTAALKGCHDVQNLGAVQTYLRRYLWVMAFEIVEHDPLDSGAENGKKKPAGTAALAWESLNDEEKEQAEETGNKALTLWGNGKKQAAIDLLCVNNEPSFKTAVWSMLPSAMRSEIKKLTK